MSTGGWLYGYLFVPDEYDPVEWTSIVLKVGCSKYPERRWYELVERQGYRRDGWSLHLTWKYQVPTGVNRYWLEAALIEVLDPNEFGVGLSEREGFWCDAMWNPCPDETRSRLTRITDVCLKHLDHRPRKNPKRREWTLAVRDEAFDA